MKYAIFPVTLQPLILMGMMPLCLEGILRVDLTIPIVAFCPQFVVYIEKSAVFLYLAFFSLSQAYDSENFFCISIPNMISVSGSLLHIIKL